jgi:formylglycine-generating enzyme required for sulfatase activity
MVRVPAGEFWMGCNADVDSSCDSGEKPGHKVYLEEYYIDTTEVTVAAYGACVKAGKCTAPDTGAHCNWGTSGREQHPINCVDWTQAWAYCEYVGKRLPTEAEWEKAARGTDGRVYPWGNERATCGRAVMNDGGDGCGKNSTWPVGSKPSGVSPYGAQDMSGNVREWVSDWYDSSYYGSSPSRSPSGPSGGSVRVYRGGRWDYFGAEFQRASGRIGSTPGDRDSGLGFRCARPAQ